MSALTPDEQVQRLLKYIAEIDFSSDGVTRILDLIIESDAWREFHTPNGNIIRHTAFGDFVNEQAPRGIAPPRGIATLAQQLRSIAARLESA